MSSNRKPIAKLPVFANPQRNDFIYSSSKHHKKIFTLHNPYDFSIKFRVLTSAKHRYKVIQREGVIKEKHCTDIVVRIHENIKDDPEFTAMVHPGEPVSKSKLRFEVYDLATNTELGNRDVDVFIWNTKEDFRNFSGQQ